MQKRRVFAGRPSGRRVTNRPGLRRGGVVGNRTVNRQTIQNRSAQMDPPQTRVINNAIAPKPGEHLVVAASDIFNI